MTLTEKAYIKDLEVLRAKIHNLQIELKKQCQRNGRRKWIRLRIADYKANIDQIQDKINQIECHLPK